MCFDSITFDFTFTVKLKRIIKSKVASGVLNTLHVNLSSQSCTENYKYQFMHKNFDYQRIKFHKIFLLLQRRRLIL